MYIANIQNLKLFFVKPPVTCARVLPQASSYLTRKDLDQARKDMATMNVQLKAILGVTPRFMYFVCKVCAVFGWAVQAESRSMFPCCWIDPE